MRLPTVILLLIPLLLVASAPLMAEIKQEPLAYREGDVQFEGVVCYDDAQGLERRPAILVMPEWYGLNDFAKGRARWLAGMGYVALAVDPYGKGVVAKDVEQAKALSTPVRSDRPLMRRRARAAFDALAAHPLAARSSMAAVGYCFGGTMALELARDGADLRAAISLHGGLGTGTDAQGAPLAAKAETLKTKLLVLHGADDPFVPPAEVAAFMDEMRAARADWQLVHYSGAVHAFTNPKAGDDPSKGAAFNAVAERRAHEAARAFLADLFPR